MVSELAQDLEQRYEALIRGGSTADDAWREANEQMEWPRLSLELSRTLPRVRESSGRAGVLSHLSPNRAGLSLRPLNHVVRRLRRAPMFTAIALVTLALSIGATTAIFSVVEGVLIKPLPYPQAESLVGVWQTAPGIKGFGDAIELSGSMYFTYREENRTFQDFGVYRSRGATVTGLAEPDVVPTLVVSYGTLQALGVQPKVGRWFSQADDTPGSPETVILNYGYWQRRYGGDPSVVGRTLTIDQHPHTVIGVMPAGFDFRSSPDLILPQRLEREKLSPGRIRLPGNRAAQAWRHA